MNSAEEDGRDATKPSQKGGETIESAELLDWDDSDEIPEDRDSDSDHGRPHKSKGKRIRGRPKTKPTEEARVVAAVEARRKRMRLNHGTLYSNEKNPKRHLFSPLGEWQDLSETASPTPSNPTRIKNDMNMVNAAKSSHSPIAGRVTRRKLAMQAKSIPSKPLVNTSPSLRDNVSPTTRPSLVVKLKHRRPSMTMGVDIHGTPKTTKNREMTKNNDTRQEEAIGQKTHHVKTHEQARETRNTTRATRQHQGNLATADAHNDALNSPPRKKNSTTRRRRGTVSSPVELPKDHRLDAPTSSTSDDDNASDSAKPPCKPLPSSLNTNAAVSKPSSPLQVVSTFTFAPKPPMSPRSVAPFTRGARIALENLLADHQADPLVSLIGLVEELDDTRPIVNDWEHVTVMKGGSWIYQVMRDVWDEAAADVDDEEDDEMSDEDVDIEDIVEKVGKWVDREMGRLGVVGQE